MGSVSKLETLKEIIRAMRMNPEQYFTRQALPEDATKISNQTTLKTTN
jgi:hypothetical protein